MDRLTQPVLECKKNILDINTYRLVYLYLITRGRTLILEQLVSDIYNNLIDFLFVDDCKV